MSIPAFTRGNILSACGAGAFQRGEKYAGEERVLDLDVGAKSGEILSTVAGSGHSAYEQRIFLEQGKKQVRIKGFCDCPVSYNCKHVVAALLTLRKQMDSGDFSSGDMALSSWQRRFSAITRVSAPPPAPSDQAVLYLLEPGGYNGSLSVSMCRVKRKKNGDWGKPVSIPGTSWEYEYNEYLAPQDLAIVESLGIGKGDGDWDFALEGRRGALALAEILDSGRALLPGSGPLARGAKRQIEFTWRGEGDEKVQLQVALQDCAGAWMIATTEPPFYLDVDAGQCGPIDSRLLGDELLMLCQMPPVPATSQLEMAQFLAQQLPPDTLPLPVDELRTLSAEPTPLLRLARRQQGEHDFHCASLHFLYEDLEIPAFPQLPTQLVEADAGRALLQRAQEFENGALAELARRGFSSGRLSTDPADIAFVLYGDNLGHSALLWQEFLDLGAGELRERGWQVEIDPGFRLRVTPAKGLSGELDEDSLGIQVDFDGRQIPLLPLLLRALQQNGEVPSEGIMLQMEPGQWLKVPGDWLRPVVDTLVELHGEPALNADGRLPLHRHNLAPIAQLEEELGESEFRWSGGEERRALAQQLKNLQGIATVVPPQGLNAELRPYQQEGLNWLAFLHRFRFGGILADDMGLGKTLQTLAFIQSLKERGELPEAALVVAPTSLLGNWLHEAHKFTPALRAAISHGQDRKAVLQSLADCDLVITSYALAQRDAEILAPHPFSLLVLDEAQAIKNPRAKVSQALRNYSAALRLCLTGTPLENHLGEFWAQFDFLMPGLLGNGKSFNRLYRNPIEKHGEESRQRQLRNRTAPFMLRRTKGQVAGELPPKTEIVQTVTLDGSQQKLYQTVRASMEKEVRKLLQDKGLARSHIQVLDALLKLRQICCDPSLVKIPSAAKVKQSAKLEALLEMLEEMLAEGRKILLFSQFTSMLSIVERELNKRGIAHSKLTGRTRKRDEAIDLFQSGEVPLFLISLKAGGFGLNLTAADTVIHYDPWWNPAAENQATDRAHRIGQQKAVFVYKLIAEGTIEERIQELQQRKQSLADALLSGEGTALSRLSGEEILELFR